MCLPWALANEASLLTPPSRPFDNDNAGMMILAMGRTMGYVDSSAAPTTSTAPTAIKAATTNSMADSLSVSIDGSSKYGDDSTEISSIGVSTGAGKKPSPKQQPKAEAAPAKTAKKAAPEPFVPTVEIGGDNGKENLGEPSTVTADDKEGVGFVLSPDPKGTGGGAGKELKKEESNKIFQLSDSEDGSTLEQSGASSGSMSQSGTTGVSDSLSMPSKM